MTYKKRELVLPWPPSVNHYWKIWCQNGKPRKAVDTPGLSFRKNVAEVINYSCNRKVKFDADENLRVQFALFPPDNRRRDVDNFLKSLLDAITHAGLWEDDSQVKNLSIGMMQPNPSYKRGGVQVVIDNLP